MESSLGNVCTILQAYTRVALLPVLPEYVDKAAPIHEVWSMVSTFRRVWLPRVWLPILLVVVR